MYNGKKYNVTIILRWTDVNVVGKFIKTTVPGILKADVSLLLHHFMSALHASLSSPRLSMLSRFSSPSKRRHLLHLINQS